MIFRLVLVAVPLLATVSASITGGASDIDLSTKLDCWMLGTAVVDSTGHGGDVISGPEDCDHLLPGTAGKIEPNPLRKYPGVVVQSEEPAVSAREEAVSDSAVADSEPPSSGFPWAWLLGAWAKSSPQPAAGFSA